VSRAVRVAIALGTLAVGVATGGVQPDAAPEPIAIGSKAFTESVILGEIAAQLASASGASPRHVRDVGGTRLLWEALRSGQLDVYPEYTGTLRYELLAGEPIDSDAALRARVEALGLRMTRPLGFNNTYALGMKEGRAAELGVRTISDLRAHPTLVLRFGNEFIDRADGWPALRRRYDLPHTDVRGIEHALAYEGLDRGIVDVTDLYATDAKIRALGIRTLRDDLGHFPAYDAVFLYRADLVERATGFIERLASLAGALDAEQMIAMNARVEIDGAPEARVAADFVAERGIRATDREVSLARRIAGYALEHLNMVCVSLAAAIFVAIPLGVAGATWRRSAQPILGAVGIIQTIPAIALLVLLIRPVAFVTNDLGYPQAVVALFLYSLLPIVRGTHTGLTNLPPAMHESALALGLPTAARLWRIELPLASPAILAGIKTAAVINVGFATLGGFIGAGGFGEPIFAGIRLNNTERILYEGALPAAALAIVVQLAFELVERVCVPRGLRIRRSE